MAKRKAKFEIFESSAGAGFYWRLVAGNGEIVATGESYTRRESAVRAAKQFADLVKDAELIEVVE